MVKHTLKLFIALLAVSFLVYSCSKESIQLPDDDLAPVITYKQGEPIEGQYIVVFKDDAFPTAEKNITPTNYDDAKKFIANQALNILSNKSITDKEILQSYAKAIKGVALQLTEAEVETLRKDENVKYIEQDQMVHVTMGGPPGGGGGGGGGGGQSTPWGITRVGGAVSGASGTAWIIDSGIDLTHPDLNVDVSRSASFLGGKDANDPNDANGHGTHVAGTVAAIDNSEGVVGVAAGATVVSVRVLNRRGSGTNSGVIAGVDYVGANAQSGDAANMSLGGGASQAVDDAVSGAAGPCKFVLAAGNSSTHANNSSPARVNGSGIYTVSSMAQGDVWSSFSNYGNPPVDYCAPGSSIESTWKSGGYNTISGTSMAAPHVCGILLLGNIGSDGNVSGDPDGNPDPIAHH